MAHAMSRAAPTMDPDTHTHPALDVESGVKSAYDRGFRVVVWNDPVNLMDYVTHVFQRIFGWARAKAQVHMLEVHHAGKSVVARETREKAEHYVHQLHHYGLTATMEQVDD